MCAEDMISTYLQSEIRRIFRNNSERPQEFALGICINLCYTNGIVRKKRVIICQDCSISTQFILLILTSYKMLGSKGILVRQTLYKFLTQKGDELMLEVKNLTFQVNENGIERSIVENISFNVEDGEMLVITGPNGGGKSTLAKVLMGIDQASAGQIILDGTDISDYDINHRAEAGIGYAFQQPPRFKGMTVSKLLSLAAGEDLTRDVCCRLLSTVGLCANEYIEREVDGTLSGGEMKRLEIATVLAKPHKLCIFDEPVSSI